MYKILKTSNTQEKFTIAHLFSQKLIRLRKKHTNLIKHNSFANIGFSMPTQNDNIVCSDFPLAVFGMYYSK